MIPILSGCALGHYGFFVPESCHILKLKLEAQTFVSLNLENRKLIEEVVSRRNCFRVQNVPFSCEVYPDPGNCWPDYVSSLYTLMSGFWTEKCHGSWELLEAEEKQPMRCVTLPEVLKEKSFLVVAKLLHTSECLWIIFGRSPRGALPWLLRAELTRLCLTLWSTPLVRLLVDFWLTGEWMG